jgi:hypothetical protein
MGTDDRRPREHLYGRATSAQRRAVFTATLWTLAGIGLLVALATVLGGAARDHRSLDPVIFFRQP